MQKYNGVAPDTRTKKEKAKDFNAKELLVSGTNNTFRKVSSLSEVKGGELRNQDGSGACVSHALAKAIEMGSAHIGDLEVALPKITATYPYQNRSNKPESGSSPVELANFVRKNLNYLEALVPSENMNDSQLDSYKIDSSVPKIKGIKINYFVDSTPEFEEVASYVSQYGNCMLLIDSDYAGYVKDIPTPSKRNHQVRHEICVVDSINLDGVDYLVMDDSWGIFGNSELAQRGQRLITREAFYKMVEQAIVIVVSKEEVNQMDYSKYLSLPKMEFGNRSKYVLKLQEMLKESGYMGKEIATINYDSRGNSYGYYGTATANAVLKWQLDNIKSVSQTQLKTWAGKYFGPSSLQAIKNLSLVKGEETENTNMTNIKFRLDKASIIAGAIFVFDTALQFLQTLNVKEIDWSTAGLLAVGTTFLHYLAQAALKKIGGNKG